MDNYDEMLELCAACRSQTEKRDVNDVLLAIEHTISYSAKRAAEGYIVKGFPLESCAKAVGLLEDELSRIKEILEYNGYGNERTNNEMV